MSIQEIAIRARGLSDPAEIQAGLREMKVDPADVIAKLKAAGVSFSKVGLEAGLKAMGYELTGRVTLYTIKNSQGVRREDVIKGIQFLDYCPIMSPNRAYGMLQFTVVPYRKPEIFEETQCESKDIAPEEVWRLVEAVGLLVTRDNSPLATQKALAFNDKLAVSGSISSSVVDYVHKTPSKGRALDLGCGPGLNAEFLLEEGWTVTAVDHNSKALDIARKEIKTGLERLTLKKMNIVTAELPAKSYELVVCTDVLQYIDPLKLRKVLETIHRTLVPNGTFIGTLLFSSPSTKEFADSSMRAERVYFYPGAFMVPAILKASGFRVDKCSFQPAHEPLRVGSTIVEFLATKV